MNGIVVAGPEKERISRRISNLTGDIYIGGEFSGDKGFYGVVDEAQLRNDVYATMLPLDVRLNFSSMDSAAVSVYGFGMWPDEEPATLAYEIKNIRTGQVIHTGDFASFEGKRVFGNTKDDFAQVDSM